jgi:hypothetical protein
LCSGCPHRRAFASIQHAKLKHGQVSGSAHNAAECVDFPDYSSLRDAPNGGITGHLTNGFERARYKTDSRSGASRSDGSLSPRMTCTDDDDVEIRFR